MHDNHYNDYNIYNWLSCSCIDFYAQFFKSFEYRRLEASTEEIRRNQGARRESSPGAQKGPGRGKIGNPD
ncbi:hypothetical protein [Methanosarcina vacuolata]|uniref:Uncharacterized protein n=1 Tax=Methanosarcina vacuolata Z-761 TaxID=1434123 RepID=A0A0E3Q3R6_9EURY|nr:hypothetical protein [Methanosarcina vacuolata]AKB43288.1 hypothetical protein MSVAZ_1019 [Methanosarcina vacuolata Z-761]